MVEIVRFCELSRDKVQIMNKMSLNNIYAEAYLAILTQQKLLMQNNNKYLRTEQGHRFLTVNDRFTRVVEKAV
jgi:predicted transcriptional regulator